jgi:hypothetical protein
VRVLPHAAGRLLGAKRPEAVFAYREALKEFTPEAAPYYHQIAQKNLDQANELLMQRRGK